MNTARSAKERMLAELEQQISGAQHELEAARREVAKAEGKIEGFRWLATRIRNDMVTGLDSGASAEVES